MSTDKEIVVEMEYLIEAPIETVFDYLSNPVNDANWQSSCDAVTVSDSEKKVQEGYTYQIHFSFLSRKMQFEAKTIEYDYCKSYGYSSLTGPMTYNGRYEFIESDNGVLVKWRFASVPGKFFGIIPKSLLKKTLLKKSGEDIDRLQRMFKERFDLVK